jgi:hypothetical protein
VCSYVVDLEL